MSLINEANFFVVFIALIVIFFLVGFLMGNLFDRPKNTPNKREKNPKKEGKETSPQTDTLGQDNQNDLGNPDLGQNQRPQDYRNRYHDRYW